MTTLRRWLTRALAAREPFPSEFAPERLDQARPLARPAGWHQAQVASRAHFRIL
ncbi:MAG TPA: hypothetical protein VF310_02985 [Vicinamibacteria bacterium]